MEIILAKSAGYCFGVQRALDMVYEKAADSGGKRVYTLGPIIHNKEVVGKLEELGVHEVDEPEDVPEPQNAILVIRSHGVAKEVQERAEKAGLEIADATCPFVKKIHGLVREKSREGYHVIVTGDASHPEVQGILGWAEGRISVIKDENEAACFEAPSGTKLFIVSQTTFNRSKFEYIVEKIKEKGYDTHIINTICSATSERQSEAAELAGRADTMIVIGDRESSNTRKLAEICRERCKDTYHIQTVHELTTVQSLKFGKCVGITAGASTPNNIIQEVIVYVRGKYFQ